MISSTAALNSIPGTGNTAYAISAYAKQKQADTPVIKNNDGDTVELSTGGLLNKIGEFKLPTLETVRELSAGLSSDLGTLFRHLGISSQPPVDITYDYTTNSVKVTGDRPDTAKIEKLLNGSENLKEQIRTLSAVSSHAYRIQESIKFQEEYRAAKDPRAVVAKYSYLFNSNRQTSVGLRYGGTVDVVVNGKVWSDVNQTAEQMVEEKMNEMADEVITTFAKRDDTTLGTPQSDSSR